MFKFNLGDELKDTLTEFQGVAIGRNEFLDSSRRYCLQAKLLTNDKTPLDGVWVDEYRLKLIKQSNLKSIGFSPPKCN